MICQLMWTNSFRNIFGPLGSKSFENNVLWNLQQVIHIGQGRVGIFLMIRFFFAKVKGIFSYYKLVDCKQG